MNETVSCDYCGKPLRTDTAIDGTKNEDGENICWDCVFRKQGFSEEDIQASKNKVPNYLYFLNTKYIKLMPSIRPKLLFETGLTENKIVINGYLDMKGVRKAHTIE